MDAQFVWTDATGQGRNRFALLVRALVVSSPVRSALLHIFVDNRYRVRVNGQVAGYGPIRFQVCAPEHDTIDLAPWLVPGANTIAIEAWSPGANNFQASRASSGGAIAWGSVVSERAEDLATPGLWRARVGEAWDADSPPFSFAQGPLEICDGRQLPASWFAAGPAAHAGERWLAPVAIAKPQWGPLTARSIPPLTLRVDVPARLASAARLDDSEDRLVARFVATGLLDRAKGHLRVPCALCIHSPTAQRVTIGTFWGPSWMNGQELAHENDPLLGNRQNAVAELRAGWNCWFAVPEILTEVWGVLVAVPRAAGLTLRAAPDIAAPRAMLMGPARFEDEPAAKGRGAPKDCAELQRLGWAWTQAPESAMPAREAAWDRTAAVVARNATVGPLALAPVAHVLIYDLGGEHLGHPRISLDAPAGTVIDLALDERLRADGQLALFATNPFTDTVDRIITDGSRRPWEAFHPRGGRYLQVTIRPPAEARGELRVHEVGMRDAGAAVPMAGRFACADPVLTWAFACGAATLRACIEDAFLDCPWRERGTYLGDALVEGRALAAASGDLAVAWRSAAIAAQAQRPDGLLVGCNPSWMDGGGGDFTLIWILCLRDMWAFSGDLGRLRALWPTVGRILSSPQWRDGPNGLWLGDNPGSFIDWGATEAIKGGESAVINAFRVGTLQAAAEMAQALGSSEAARYRDEAARVAERFRATLWRPARGMFAATTTPAGEQALGLHGTVLALAYGIPTPEQARAAIDAIAPLLARNAERALATSEGEYLELYFLHYACEALYRYGRADLAEPLLRSHYQPQMARGAWTLWEALRWGAQSKGSLCHAWSATPNWVAHERILGVRSEPGRPDQVLIAPDSRLGWAEGVVPHPRGPLTVSWRREGDVLRIEATVPAGVQVRIDTGAAFAGCRVLHRITS